MKWHAFDLERGRSIAYRRIPKAVRADHHDLLFFCAEQENSGVIRGAGAYTDDDWLLLGLRPDDVEAVLAHDLARWLNREETEALIVALTPSEELLAQESPEKRALLERCRITSEAIERVLPHAVDPDRHTSSIQDRSWIDLVVLDFDLGGQVLSQFISEMKRKAAKVRWDRQKQLELLTPPEVPRGPVPHLVDPGSIPDRHTAGDARAMHSYSNRSEIPPQTPPRAGGRLRFEPTREERIQLESFWGWFLRSRPTPLNSSLWGGAKNASLRMICARAIARELPVAQVLLLIRADLAAKFATPRWVTDVGNSKRGFRSYVANDDWVPPPPENEDPLDRELRETEQRIAKVKRLQGEQKHELEVRATWAEEMPDKPFPSTLEEAERLLREKHGWKN